MISKLVNGFCRWLCDFLGLCNFRVNIVEQVKEFHPDARKNKDDCDIMIRRVIKAYEVLEFIR